jgi:hypothetical protein
MTLRRLNILNRILQKELLVPHLQIIVRYFCAVVK